MCLTTRVIVPAKFKVDSGRLNFHRPTSRHISTVYLQKNTMCLTKDQCHTLQQPIEEAMKQRGFSESLAKSHVDVPRTSSSHRSLQKNTATSNHNTKSSRVLASSPFISLTNDCPSMQSLVRCIDIPLEQERACLLIRAQHVLCRSSRKDADCKCT